MLGLGLSLTPADFPRVVRYLKPVLVGLVCQIVLLPMACFLIVQGFAFEATLVVSMMLLAASSGGVTANLYSYLTYGDVALSITSTAVNSMIVILTTPLVVSLSLQYFVSGGQAISLQFGKVIQVFVIVLDLVVVDMLMRNRPPVVADRLQKPVKILSALLLLAVILLVLTKDWQAFITYASVVGLAALAFNLLSLMVSYWVSRLLRLPKAQAVAISTEISIHNGVLAIALVLNPSLLSSSTMVTPPAIYGVSMFFTAAAFGWWVNRGHQAALAPVTTSD